MKGERSICGSRGSAAAAAACCAPGAPAPPWELSPQQSGGRGERYLGSAGLHFPAPLLLLVFIHLQPGLLEARSEAAGAGARPLPSLYLHSLPSPTRLPTPHTRNCQRRPAAPPIRSRARACARALRRRCKGGAPPLLPSIGASALPPSSRTPMSGMRDSRGSLLLVNCAAGRFVRTGSRRRAAWRPLPAGGGLARERASVRPSLGLAPSTLLAEPAEVVLGIRCALSPAGRSLPSPLVLRGRVL